MVYADLAEGSILLKAEWNETDLVKAIPGSSHARGEWRIPLTWASAAILRGTFGQSLQMSEALIEALWLIRSTRVDPANEFRDIVSWGHGDQRLFPFQRAGVVFMRRAEDGLLGDDMGTGKTVQLSSIINEEGDLPALIIVPNSTKEHWARHIRQWTVGTPYVINGNQPARRKLITDAKKDPRAVVIMNLESLRTFSRLAPYGSTRLKRCTNCDKYGDPTIKSTQCEVHPKELNGFGFKTVLLDEAHRVKDPASKQTRAVWAVMHDPSVEHRWAATGTPIANHLGDLWSVMHAVAPAEYPTRTKFLERYALMGWGNFGGMEIVGLRPDTREEFFTFFKPRFRRMPKGIVLTQLPKKVYVDRYVDLTPSQRKLYTQWETELFARDDNGNLMIAPSQLAARTRLDQLTCATIAITDQPDLDDPRTWKIALKEPSAKLDELENVLDELGDQQSVIVAVHSQFIELAAKRLEKKGIKHLLITGDVSPIDRQKALDALNAGHIQTVLFTAQAGGVGLDMSAASNIIFLQLPWSMVDYKQAEDRVHRIGSERHESVNVITILARDTCDNDKRERLRIKLERLEEITQDRVKLAAAGESTDFLDAVEAEIVSSDLGVDN